MCEHASIDELTPQQLQHVLDEFVRAERLELYFASFQQQA
jgi:hypothetical protein